MRSAIVLASLVSLLVVTPPIPAQTPAGVEPTILVRLKSFDGLLADVKYVAELAGQRDKAQEIDGIVQALAGPKGLAGTGIDTKRPFALYANVGAAGIDSKAVLMVPIADDNAFMESATELLGRVNVRVKKGDDGIFTVSSDQAPVEAFVRFANGYAYVTAPDRSVVAGGSLPLPARLIGDLGPNLLTATVRIDRIPDMIKQLFLQQLQVQAANAKEKRQPNETSAQARFKEQFVDYTTQTFSSVVSDGASFDLRLAIDRAAEEMSLNMSLTGKSGTALAKDIQSLKSRETRFGGLAADALRFSLNIAVPPSLRDSFAAVVDEGIAEAVRKEQDPAKKEAGRVMFAALAPTLKAGLLDFAFGIQGPDTNGHIAILGGLQVKEGKGIEQAVKDVVAKLPEKERKAVRFDALTIGGMAIHRVEPGDKIDNEGKRLFGATPSGLVAFQPDAVLFAIGGSGAAESMKSLLATRSAPRESIVETIASVARLSALDAKNQAATRAAAQEVFGPDPRGQDVFRSSITGGDALTLRVSVKTRLITFASKAQERSEK